MVVDVAIVNQRPYVVFIGFRLFILDSKIVNFVRVDVAILGNEVQDFFDKIIVPAFECRSQARVPVFKVISMFQHAMNGLINRLFCHLAQTVVTINISQFLNHQLNIKRYEPFYLLQDVLHQFFRQLKPDVFH